MNPSAGQTLILNLTSVSMRPFLLETVAVHSSSIKIRDPPCVSLADRACLWCFCSLSTCHQTLYRMRIRSCSQHALLFGTKRIQGFFQSVQRSLQGVLQAMVSDLSAQLVYRTSRNVAMFASLACTVSRFRYKSDILIEDVQYRRNTSRNVSVKGAVHFGVLAT